MTPGDVRAIGLRRDPTEIPDLVTAGRHPDGPVRVMACRALGWMRVPAAQAPLCDALSDPLPDVRAAAAAALAVIVGPQGATDEVGPALIACLSDASPIVRASAARALGWMHADAAEALRAALVDDADPEVQAQAARALGRLHAEPAIGDLVAALDAPHPGLRHHAATALAALGADVAAAQVGARLADPDPEVRLAALRAHSRLTGDLAPARAALADANPGVRCAAVILLKRAPAEQALLITHRQTETHPEVRFHLPDQPPAPSEKD